MHKCILCWCLIIIYNLRNIYRFRFIACKLNLISTVITFMLTRSRAQSKRKESSFTENSSATQEVSPAKCNGSAPVAPASPVLPPACVPESHEPRSLIPPVFALVASLAFGACYINFGSPGMGEYISAACCGVLGLLLFVSMAFIPDGPFIRPSQIMWRIALGIGLFYMCILIPFLFIPLETAREALRIVFDSRLGVPLPSRSYAEACGLDTWQTIFDQLDVFVALHIFGWVFKALIYRDVFFCWILSIAFELLEYALQHQLPNFAECWWDHWILDVLLCNAIGILVGLVLGRFLCVKPFAWAYSSSRFEQKPTSLATKSFKNYLQVLFLLVGSLTAEITCFYIKHLLWIPTVHPLNAFRLLLIVFLGSGAVREFYDLFSKDCHKSSTTQKARPFAAVTSIILIFESIICVRWGQDQFPNPAPLEVKVCALFAAFVLLVLIPTLLFILPSIFGKHKKESK